MKIHGLYFMSANEILQQLAVLVVCHGLAVGQITSHYFLVQRPMPWVKAREFCQRHYVDLAVLSTEEQYFKILNAMPANKASFWLGLQRQSVSSEWQWVNGEELSYEHWYRKNHEGHCASLEAMLEKSKKLLPRYCMEPHMIVCQGPDSPQSVTVDSVGTDHVNLKWNISAFMQMTPHSYNVKMCTSLCETHYFFSTNGSTDMSINISNLTSATEYFLEISAFVVRPDRVTGGKIILQTNPTVVQFKTGHGSEIIGGNEVQPHSLPFMALLETSQPVCGGVLINPSWVLTAAHCIDIKKVLLGVHSIKGDKNESRQVRKVKRRHPHPCFENTEKVNDLMLLQLDKPVKKTKTVDWLSLPSTSKEPAAGSTCLVAGWGTVKNNVKEMSDVLRSANVTVIDRVKCNSPDYYNLKPVITSSMICAGSDGKDRTDTCKGDSGGPLLCSNMLAGITSFGKHCGVKKNPGVYSFLSQKQLIWIKKTMNSPKI